MRQFKLLVLSLLCITAAGGAALKAAGAGVNVTKAITAYDIAGNTVMSTQAGVDMVENGVDAQNALQLLAGIGGTGTAIYSNKSVLSLSDIELNPTKVGGVDVPNRTVTNLNGIPASEANAPFVAKGWSPPYAAGTRPRTFTTGAPVDFVRVHGENNPTGAFLVRADEIAGMTPAQIQKHLALPQVPTHIRPVTVPSGTKMQVGRVGAQPDFNVPANGGIQYQLLEQIPDNAFGPSTLLP